MTNWADLEQEIVERLKQKDEDALVIFIDEFYAKAKTIAFNIVRDNMFAEEVCQDAFLKLFKNINNYKGESNLKNYFLKIVINCAREKYRLEKNREIVNQGIISLKKQEGNLEEQILLKEKIKKLQNIIDKLPLRQKEILILKSKEELKIKEIAKILNLTEGAVKSNLFKALKNLKKIVNDLEIQEELV